MFRNNPEKRKKLNMWSLYAVLLFGVLLVQTVLLSKIAVAGVHFDLLPMLVSAVAVVCGAEKGGIFAIGAGLLWALSGGSDGGMTLACLTVSAVTAGYLCEAVFNRSYFTAVVMALLCHAITAGGVLLLRVYMDGIGIWGLWKVLLQLALSLPLSPVLYWLAAAIRKAGP